MHLFCRKKGPEAKSKEYEVPWMAAAFPRCTATAILCLKWCAERGSRVVSAMRRPRSLIKQCASCRAKHSQCLDKGVSYIYCYSYTYFLGFGGSHSYLQILRYILLYLYPYFPPHFLNFFVLVKCALKYCIHNARLSLSQQTSLIQKIVQSQTCWQQ